MIVSYIEGFIGWIKQEIELFINFLRRLPIGDFILSWHFVFFVLGAVLLGAGFHVKGIHKQWLFKFWGILIGVCSILHFVLKYR